MGVINFASRRSRAAVSAADEHAGEHAGELAMLRRRVDEAPAQIDQLEAVGVAVNRTAHALEVQDWDTAVEVVRAHDALADASLDPHTLAHRNAVVGLLEETLDLPQAQHALREILTTIEGAIDELFRRGEEDLARLAELEQGRENDRVSAPSKPATPTLAEIDAIPAVAVPPIPQGIRWGRRTEKRLPELWALAHRLVSPEERVETILLLARKRPPLDVLVITDQCFYAVDSAAVAATGPEISGLRSDVIQVSVNGFSERLVVNTRQGQEIDLGPLGHSGDRALAQEQMLPIPKMSWDT